MPRLSILLLGSFRVGLGGEPVTGFESDKVRALLAYLAIERGQSHRREKLAGLFWPELPERSARSNLRVALANLRKVLGDHTPSGPGDLAPPFLLVTRQTIRLNPEADIWLDVTALIRRLKATGRPQIVVNRLVEAVELYRGGFLEGFSLPDSAAVEEWILLEREEIQRQIVVALRRLAGWHERRGEFQEALGYARRQVWLEPWQEQGQRQVMRLLALTGQRNAALAQYHSLRRELAQELGVEPEDETEALYGRIHEGQGPPMPAQGTPHNLPASLVPLAGREKELDEIYARLKEPGCRLLTLVGPGGAGKTRLALEAAADQVSAADLSGSEGHPASTLADGVFFVALSRLGSAEGIALTVADVLGFTFRHARGLSQQLFEYLSQKQMLLVLDSFEHLIEGGAVWVAQALKAARKVKILVTSRAKLNLQAESTFAVDGIRMPGREGPGSSAQGALHQLGSYEIMEELASAGVAAVYRAYQASMDRYVAIKIIGVSLASDEEAVARFQREARLIGSLEHLHIVPVYDFDGAHEPPYIVMRYQEGGSLRDVLAQGPLPLEKVDYLMQQIAGALHYAHQQGIVHRDVKPDNILIDAEGNAFVSDFGIAIIDQKRDPTSGLLAAIGQPLGTPGYMAPEQLMGRSPIDERADIYALGVMLYEMVTGALPYPATLSKQALDEYLSAPIPDVRDLRPDLPAALNDVIRRAMAKDPEERYRSAAAFAAATIAATACNPGGPNANDAAVSDRDT